MSPELLLTPLAAAVAILGAVVVLDAGKARARPL
jgi:hypothetical protein